MKRALILAAAAIVGGLVLSGASAEHTDGRLAHWERAVDPQPIYLGDNLSPAWDGLLADAAAQWSTTEFDGQWDPVAAVVVDNPLLLIPAPGIGLPDCGTVRGRAEVCSGPYGATGWAGLTNIWYDAKGHIAYATVQLNESVPYDEHGRRVLLCHELGHVVGLGHPSTDGSSQNTCLDYSWQSTEPNLHDFGAATALYDHQDAPPRRYRLFTPGLSKDGDGGHVETPAPAEQLAAIVERARDSREELVITPLPGGLTRATFITWAE